MAHEIHVIDSHTAGEPTRVVVDGGPPLGDGPLVERLRRFRSEFDAYRTAIVTEPRGSDVLVGALLCEPTDPSCLAGVIFFNNVGYLGMCGHGMIGVMETLKNCGRIAKGESRMETPVGLVTTHLHEDGSVSVGNVESYRVASDVKIDADGVGTVVGDVAWGGNWFFLAREPRQELVLDRVRELKNIALAIRNAINEAGHPEVDHVELFGEAHHPDADSRNFVLCPGRQYDRSPCGTGTSAKMACLAADGKLRPGQPWIQEGILGTSFVGHYQWSDESKQRIQPVINGRAFVTAESHLRLSQQDPFCWGIGDPATSAPGI
jgi:4-hydroxyproline epimerase